MAADPKYVEIRCLVHAPMILACQVRAHHQDLVSRRHRVLLETGRTLPGTNIERDLVSDVAGSNQAKLACPFDG